ncbi:SDR family oxidoreductase [Victivallis sp. Marseille-Q1083]|uniref:SDR family oxidoreductase n=1 Tax=Victivallis sp. Marseille-Q1083 TaxID=2717288 RepID=UPI001588A1C4|nr:SDR family oxidoreductase [Victivallis sp. Marseille-Q1083]
MELKGKRILITGGAVRVGAAIAGMLADAGARVVIHCRRSQQAAGQLLAALPGEGHALAVADWNEPGAVEALLPSIGRVDGLVNNASVFHPGTLAEDNPEADADHWRVNYLAPLALMRALNNQAGLTEGVILNLLDQEVAQSAAWGGIYGLSKRALRDATLAAALEWAPRIRVNGLAPGPVLAPPGLEHLRMRKTLRQVPMQRPVAMADLLAGCRFLLENDSVTGQILYVDGGQHLRQRAAAASVLPCD